MIMVAVESSIKSEQTDRALRSVQEGLRQSLPRGEGWRQSRFFQSRTVPGNVLLVSVWRSLEALTIGSTRIREDFDRPMNAVGAAYHRFIGQPHYDSVLQGRTGSADASTCSIRANRTEQRLREQRCEA